MFRGRHESRGGGAALPEKMCDTLLVKHMLLSFTVRRCVEAGVNGDLSLFQTAFRALKTHCMMAFTSIIQGFVFSEL